MAVKFEWMNRLEVFDPNQRAPVRLEGTGKAKSRLEEKTTAGTEAKTAEKAWKDGVWDLDKSRCRKCGRKVERGGKQRPARGEAHHVAGRAIPLIRWDVRNGILLCAVCHEQVTGRVNEKWIVVAAAVRGFYEVMVKGGMQRFINGRRPVTFERVA
jgi:hypothetical protein